LTRIGVNAEVGSCPEGEVAARAPDMSSNSRPSHLINADNRIGSAVDKATAFDAVERPDAIDQANRARAHASFSR